MESREVRELNKEIKALAYVMGYLQTEIGRTELTEDICESNDDFIIYGRKELAEVLLSHIHNELDWTVDEDTQLAVKEHWKW